jgi:RimJ/RimL family protein N-acetyltransferase
LLEISAGVLRHPKYLHMTILKTERLILEPITARHYEGMRKTNADPVVMRFINAGKAEGEEATCAAIARITARWAEWGYLWWALIRSDNGEMVGLACLQNLGGVPGRLEIGWRLCRDSWGMGYASEAARAIVQFAFEVVGAKEVYAIALPDNVASINVMKRLGMYYTGIETHSEKQCATYRLDRKR